jgi:uncharacterized membrane protein
MQSNTVSAVFDSQSEAESAIQALRSAGITDSSISLIGKQDGNTTETTASGESVDNHDEPTSLISKVAAGSGLGALLGVAALAIPGVGPLVAAGAIAESAIGGAALAGTAVGAAAGGLTDVLTKHGVSSEDSRYYHDRINQGGIFVSVDASQAGIQREEVQEILYNAGGHNAGRSRVA